jgi:hypothetical protein
VLARSANGDSIDCHGACCVDLIHRCELRP